MHWIWRALLAAILVGGSAIGFSHGATDVAAQSERVVTDLRGPAADINDNDPDELCGSSNPRKRKKCHYNGWQRTYNENGNDNSVVAAAPEPTMTGVSLTQDGLTVELWRSVESPVVNLPLTLVVKGSGAPIERVWWWAEGPVYTGPFVDDLAFVGTMSYDCDGSATCAWSWPVTTRYLGPYMLHARIRDTAGREVQADWKFETVEVIAP